MTNEKGQDFDDDAPSAAEAPVIAPGYLTGQSGTTYKAIDLMTEMNGYHEQAIMDMLAPILPVLPGLFEAYSDGQELKAGFDLMGMATMLVTHQIHRRALALLFLPINDRKYRADEVEARAKDFMELTLEDVVSALSGFFDGASSSFQRISSAFSGRPAVTPITTNGAS